MGKTEIVINPQYRQYASFVNSVHDRFDKEGITIYQERNLIKVFDVGEMQLNVKRYKIPAFPNRIVYTFLRAPKAVRAYEYALKLFSKGFDTPVPIAYIIEKRSALISYSYFISIHLPGMRNMYEFGKGTLEGREHILTALGKYSARLHQAGICHKDYSPGNILFKETAEKEVRFFLVDINRMTFSSSPLTVKEGCKNLARLWGKENLFRLVAKSYAEARGADTEECTRWLLHYRERFWSRYARKHELFFEYE